MRRCELSAAITQLMSQCLWSGCKWKKGYKEIASPFNCYDVNRQYSRRESQIEKKKEKKEQILRHVRTDSRCMWMKSVFNLSWQRSLLYRTQSIDLQNKSMDWFLCEKNLHDESVNALLLSCIHWDIFLDYDKIIDISASKYQRRMLLVNPLSKN